MVFLFIGLGLFLLVSTIRYLRFRQVCSIFKHHSIIVTGERGSGKDLLFSNVVSYRNEPYCSNMRYNDTTLCYPFEPVYLKLGGNTFKNFSSGNIIPYSYPLPDKVDYYISDAGVYFPSQECNTLNKLYPETPLFQALLRHLGNANFHCNVQNINRLWDKIREQSDYYIRCIRCKVSKRGIVSQEFILYDKYQSCVDRVKPFKAPVKLFGKGKLDISLERQRFNQSYGMVRKFKIKYKNKGKYDSRRFKAMLENGGDLT